MQQNQKQQKLKPKLEIPNAETADKDKFETGGGYSMKFYTGRLHRKVQTLTL